MSSENAITFTNVLNWVAQGVVIGGAFCTVVVVCFRVLRELIFAFVLNGRYVTKEAAKKDHEDLEQKVEEQHDELEHKLEEQYKVTGMRIDALSDTVKLRTENLEKLIMSSMQRIESSLRIVAGRRDN